MSTDKTPDTPVEVKRVYLTRDEILSAPDIQTKDVHVPEWYDGYVCVIALSGKDRDRWENDIVELKKKKTIVKDNVRASLVARTIVRSPEEHTRVFNSMDIEELGKKSGKALQRVYAVAAELGGITEEDVEELAKNSKPDQHAF